MSGRHWSAAELDFIIHCYSLRDPYPHADAVDFGDMRNSLMERGFIEYRDGIPIATEKGRVFVELLLQTPAPRNVWLDPRTSREILEESGGSVISEILDRAAAATGARY